MKILFPLAVNASGVENNNVRKHIETDGETQ